MIDFYFDFLSPYGYIGALKIEELAEKYGKDVEWHSMLLGVSVMNVMGLKPLLETPLKGKYVLDDVPRLASVYGLPIVLPENGLPNPIPPARAFTWVKNKDSSLATKFGLAVYRAQWEHGKDISRSELLAEIAESFGFDGQELLKGISENWVKDALKSNVQNSLDKGIFGSPTFVVDDQMIWGADRIWMVEHWLCHNDWEVQS